MLCDQCPINQFFLTQTNILKLNSSQIHSSLQIPSVSFWRFYHRDSKCGPPGTTVTRNHPDRSLVREVQLEPKALTQAGSQNGWPWQLPPSDVKSCVNIWIEGQPLTGKLLHLTEVGKQPQKSRCLLIHVRWYWKRPTSSCEGQLAPTDLFQGRHVHPSFCHTATSFGYTHQY